MSYYQILEWDSEFFGIKTAKITVSDLSQEELSDLLFELKENSIQLVYWALNRKVEDDLIHCLGGALVDIRKTLSVDLINLPYDKSSPLYKTEPYDSTMMLSDIESLAVQSGLYSRFAVDPKFPRDKYIALYKVWINKSLNRELADEVLIVREFGRVIGFITLYGENGKGCIGLLSVSKAYRRKNYGELLVRSAQRWFLKNGYEIGQVVTQSRNVPACNLYKKCGYSTRKKEYFYHFWL